MGYTYSGNRLTSLTKDGTPYSYAYDSNGNATTDGLRGMTIAYNHLNLPKTVTKGSDVLTYIYDATGSKLAEKINTTVNNFYTGAVVYKGDKTIDYITTTTGLIRKVGSDFVRQYNINDHLGNVRAVVNQSGTIEQASDYYPYGLAFNYNNLDKNRYLYNGKELQNQTLATTFFGVYDYGARYYDPVIGRWHSVDPMGEDYYEFTPYNYGLNNPERYIDPTGMQARDTSKVLPSVTITAEKSRMSEKAVGGILSLMNFVSRAGRPTNQAFGKNDAPFMENFQQGVYFLNLAYAPYSIFLNTRGFSSSKVGNNVKNSEVKGGTTVLGHYPTYSKLAGELGAKRFNIPTTIWNKMTTTEQWAANQKFLDRLILRGDNIRLATPLSQVKPGSFYQKELNYLFDKGYKVSSDGLWLVK